MISRVWVKTELLFRQFLHLIFGCLGFVSIGHFFICSDKDPNLHQSCFYCFPKMWIEVSPSLYNPAMRKYDDISRGIGTLYIKAVQHLTFSGRCTHHWGMRDVIPWLWRCWRGRRNRCYNAWADPQLTWNTGIQAELKERNKHELHSLMEWTSSSSGVIWCLWILTVRSLLNDTRVIREERHRGKHLELSPWA